ncbi:MAG: M28 family peptidase [Phycisphaerae bacterium]
MHLRRGSMTTAVFFLMTWATCLTALEPALGQCGGGGGAVPAKPDGKPAPGCGGAALAAPAQTASATRKPIAGTDVAQVDLARCFDSLGPDATLWYQHVQTLASPAFEGRAPGTRGIELAADYIEFYLRAYGLQPAFPGPSRQGAVSVSESYRQPLTVDGALPDGYETLGTLAINGDRLVVGEDYVITANARKGIARGAVSFVGYGLEQGEDGYSSFDDGTDLRGRVALLLRLEPLDEAGDFLWDAQSGQYSSLVAKLNAVASRGAAGVLIANPPGAKAPVQTLDPLPAIAGGCTSLPAIPTAMITPEVADRLLKLAGPKSRDLLTWRRLADQGKVRTVDLDPDVVVSLETDIEPQQVTTENVAGVLPGRGERKNEWIVIGGHYDHVGAGYGGTNPHGDTAMLLGADDNASGTAAVLILAKRLAAAYRAAPDDADLRSILFVAFTAEERGLVGSRHFVQNSPVRLSRIHAMLNLDMVGRLRQDMLWLSGFGTADEYSDLLGATLAESGLKVTTEPGSDGSDQVSFLEAGIPALHVMTGGHDEIHSPADLASTLNPAGAAKVIDLSEKIAMQLARQPEPLTYVEQSTAAASGCASRPPVELGEQSSASTGGCGSSLPRPDQGQGRRGASSACCGK